MAPFLAASVVTFYLVSKMQEMGVRCTSYAFPTLTLHERCVAAETYAKDPKNPYGAQIAKEAHH
jgi:F-type H+-transporting ATPase subunit j